MSEKDYDTMLSEVLPWLEHGDRKQIAVSLEMHPDYVQRCLSRKGRNRSWKVLRAAARIAAENKAATTRAKEQLKSIGE